MGKAVLTLFCTLAVLTTAIVGVPAQSEAGERERQIVQEILKTKKELRQAQLRYKDRHPLVMQLKRQLADEEGLLRTAEDKRMVREQKRSDLLAEKAELEIKFADLQTKYTEKHPLLKATRMELEQIDQQLSHLR